MIKLPSIHLNSEYSLLQSTIKLEKLFEIAKKEGLKELVITDRNNMYGVADFIYLSKKNNIKPIIGIDLDVDDYRMILLAKNFEGYKELMRLSSMMEHGKNVSLKDIKDFDIFVIDHPTEGFVAKEDRTPAINNFFVGSTTSANGNAIWFQETKIINKEDNKALDIMDAIKGEEIKENSFEPMITAYDESDSKVLQVKNILDQCEIEFPKEQKVLPSFPLDKVDKLVYLKKLLLEGFKNKITDKSKVNEYKERINLEVKIIKDLGFIDYFLIIWDLINWAKTKGIAIGPGRGSAAGSLVSYLLNITEVDPIEFGLLFERFLNPERVTMPDIDIDIQDNRREEVVKYLFDKYGSDNVGLISTFSKIGIKTALRDVARVMNLPLRDVDTLSKLVPADAINLESAYDSSARFRAAIDKTQETKELFKKASLIEGLPRQRGTHAAGLVISDSELINKVPTTKSSEGYNQSQYSMDHLESHGLLKIDLLGLRNLTIIQTIQEEILKNYKKKVALNKIPLDDNLTNKLLSKGDTNGVFQLESYGMKNTLKQVRVDTFDDLVSIISLFRPGPMEFIGKYADVQKGKLKIKPIHPEYDKIVKSTKGIIIYQEQIMQIAQKVSGMSFGEADILRRAISKKKSDLINSLTKKFMDGALKKGLSEDKAKIIFDNIKKFANYGFNKSHAVSYGMIAYWLGFLKARFPFEFYTASIKSSTGSLAQVKKYVVEAKSKRISIIAPSVNNSKAEVFNKDKKIILPLTLIKGFGESANKKLIEARNKYGSFEDLFDFVSKVKAKGLGDSQISALISAGALSEFGNVNTLLDSMPSAIRYAEMTSSKKDGEITINSIILPKPLLIKQKRDIVLEMNLEQKAFGFNIQAFPTSNLELENNLSNLENNKDTFIVAIVDGIRLIKDKNNNPMGIIKLTDSTTTIEAFAFNEVIKFIEDTKKGTIVKVKVRKSEFAGKDSFRVSKPWEVING